MATYATKFTEQLAERLGDAFTVDDLGGDLIIASYNGTSGSLSGYLPNVDRRTGVRRADVSDWISTAARTIRGHLPCCTERAANDARAMLAALEEL